MNISSVLPVPLNAFVLDVAANEYYDFGLPPDSTYPLKGVTYPVDYGHIPGYTSEDRHELDLYVGNMMDGKAGSIIVNRGADMPNECKFYVALTEHEVEIILNELRPVLISHKPIPNLNALLDAITEYEDKK